MPRRTSPPWSRRLQVVKRFEIMQTWCSLWCAMDQVSTYPAVVTMTIAFHVAPPNRTPCRYHVDIPKYTLNYTKTLQGNRDNIDSMAPGSAKVLTQVLKLIDVYDLYGSVAYPKHHSQSEVSDIYMLAARTRGIFTNVALQEPFGLTVIEVHCVYRCCCLFVLLLIVFSGSHGQTCVCMYVFTCLSCLSCCGGAPLHTQHTHTPPQAAAHGVPTVATCNGGPVDIMKTLHHGVVVDPTNPDAIAAELVRIVTTPELWDAMSNAGRTNIMAYSWPSHCVKYLETVEAEKQRAALCRVCTWLHFFDLSALLLLQKEAPFVCSLRSFANALRCVFVCGG